MYFSEWKKICINFTKKKKSAVTKICFYRLFFSACQFFLVHSNFQVIYTQKKLIETKKIKNRKWFF